MDYVITGGLSYELKTIIASSSSSSTFGARAIETIHSGTKKARIAQICCVFDASEGDLSFLYEEGSRKKMVAKTSWRTSFRVSFLSSSSDHTSVLPQFPRANTFFASLCLFQLYVSDHVFAVRSLLPFLSMTPRRKLLVLWNFRTNNAHVLKGAESMCLSHAKVGRWPSHQP